VVYLLHIVPKLGRGQRHNQQPIGHRFDATDQGHRFAAKQSGGTNQQHNVPGMYQSG